MKRMKYLAISVCMIAFMFASCSDVMDKRDLGAISDADVWNDALYAKAYLDWLVTQNTPAWEGTIADDCDEACDNRQWATIIYGEMTVNNVPNTMSYDKVRNLNTFIKNISTGSIDVATQNLYKAQALILRAWRYFEMVKLYGGVPMILEPQDLSDDLLVTRTKTSECIRLIVKDLDDAIAIENFPYSWTGSDAGRLNKATALALKGRVLLYWASPQFNPTNIQDRWQAAYTANEEAKRLLETNGYGLHNNFADVWFTEMNKEVVFVRRSDQNYQAHGLEAGTRPSEAGLGFHGYHKPTWELARAFPMKNGVSVDESSEYDDVHFWRNRDPRFEATIVWNSAKWPLASKSTAIVGGRLWTYREDHGYPSRSHLYCRKAIALDATVETTAASGKNATDWIEIRFAEVLMNYAECAAALGKVDEAYDVLKQIRSRAGIDAGANNMYGLKANMTKEQMFDAIVEERRIEFAFENKRFWDLRRWRKLTELNGTKRHGRKPNLLISENEFVPLRTSDIDFDKDYSIYFTDEVIETDILKSINYGENYYFYPLHSDYLIRNSKLEQTKGWENGTFDPLE